MTSATPGPMRVLFVDDDPLVLQGLRRMLRGARTSWELEFAPGGPEALDRMETAPFDVIVTDMRMPGMDGAEVLQRVMQRHPQVVRIVLSGQAEQTSIMRSIGATHQYLSKPCDSETLCQTLARAGALRELLTNADLKQVVSRLDSLPSPPALYFAVLGECQAPEGSLLRIAELVRQDPAMCAKILHLVNSAFFGRQRRVSSPLQAVQLLGLQTLRTLILSAHIFSPLSESEEDVALFRRLHDHCVTASVLARVVATREGLSGSTIEDAHSGALLHGMGELVLATQLREGYDEALRKMTDHGMSRSDAERETFGTTHDAVGAYLLGLWGLPAAVVDAVAYHDAPRASADERMGPLTIVHVADALAHELEPTQVDCASQLDLDYLAGLGVADRVAGWRDACRDHLASEVSA